MYKDGKYQVTVRGHHSDVTLEVTLTRDKIVKIDVLSENETEAFITELKDRMLPEIIANQSLQVDAISGASKLSHAVIEGLEEVVNQAGGDAQELLNQPLVAKTPAEDRQLKADVVVIGSGGAGFMAALTAAKDGAQVVVLEKASTLAAVNGVKVSGPFAVDTPVLHQKGTTLTANEVFNHVMTYTHWTPNSLLIKNYLDHSSEAVENLMEIGYRFEEADFRFKTPFTGPKGGFHLIMTPVDQRVKLWQAAYKEYGVQILYQTTATQLLTHGRKVTGVVAQSHDGAQVTIQAQAVIVAAGGYLGNKEMLQAHLGTSRVNAAAGGKSLATGDGIQMAQAIGASLDKTFGYCGSEYGGTNQKASRPATQDKFDQNLAFKFGVYGNLLVNSHGQRFMNEGLMCDYPMSYGEEPTLRNSPYYAIVDQAYVDAMRDQGLYTYMTARGANHENWFIGNYYKQRGPLASLDQDLEEGLREGWITKADTLVELQAKTGLTHLVENVNRYNGFCQTGVDEDFATNPWYLTSVSQGPFYAIENEVSAWSTMGGIKTNANCQAFDTHGQTIPGLYVVGTDNGSLMYSPYYDIPGFCYGLCIGSGVIAGHASAQTILDGTSGASE
ncbi:FAD-binding protein [Ligilactobacillus equi]|uniref:Urocanate reductase n=1 Tax=Ligilactobacillus equi DPC 6820 TaxID=1392007 RepID=V7HZ41_9LACO|nr:FAD-binding protein [Ligilactobacillus equi]ETA75157.1 hypothetical protein LEQ_1470 [Ligilactobacillus equi DPC 6820]